QSQKVKVRGFGIRFRIIDLPFWRSRFVASKTLICVLQRFFASNIEPFSFDLERLYRFTRVQPLHETTRLIGVIPSGKIRGQEREHRRGVIVKRDRGESSSRLLWFLFQVGDNSILVD